MIKLVLLKENAETSETGLKIRSLLMPVEYTRLDRMIDVMFSTANDVEQVVPLASEGDAQQVVALSSGEVTASKAYEFTDAAVLQARREQIITAISKQQRVPLVRKSRALYWSAAHDVRVACSISKRYAGKGQNPYWYAYHPAWDDFLNDGTLSYFVLGCMDTTRAFAIPRSEMQKLLPSLHTTTNKAGNTYWHIHLVESSGATQMLLPKRGDRFSLEPFLFDG